MGARRGWEESVRGEKKEDEMREAVRLDEERGGVVGEGWEESDDVRLEKVEVDVEAEICGGGGGVERARIADRSVTDCAGVCFDGLGGNTGDEEVVDESELDRE